MKKAEKIYLPSGIFKHLYTRDQGAQYVRKYFDCED